MATGPSASAAIGVFDSGLGGLTVVRELQRLLPNESIVYLGDTARVPYGTRAASTVRRYALSCADLLCHRNIKFLVVACNTASAVAIDPLEQQLGVPVIGVIHPGADAAVEAVHEQLNQGLVAPKIGVLGTAGTIRSQAYTHAVQRQLPGVAVIEQAAPLLVPLVEEGWLTGQVPTLAVERYVQPMLEAGVSVLVLGCTHYPLLVPVLSEVTERCNGIPVRIVDGARACARAVSTRLRQLRALNDGSNSATLSLLATDLPDSFLASAQRFLGKGVSDVHQVDIVPSTAVLPEETPPDA